MKKMSTFLTLLVGASLIGSCTDNKLNIDYPDYVKEETAGSYPGYSLVWSEEFDYEGLPSDKNFDYEEGYLRNDEKQDYRKSDLKYSRVEDGKLVIEAHKDPHTGKNPYTNEDYQFEYSSASIMTKNKIDFKYGRIDISAKVPTGKGLWPALWLLPEESVYGGWPLSGEIDIMEYVWGDDKHNSIYSTVHNAYSKSTPGVVTSGTFVSETLNSTFHLYSLVWKKEKIDILFDNNLVFSYDRTEDSYAKWPFDQKFYLIMNIAVGGSWGGQWGIDESTFPARMEIDYIRYYKAEDDTDDVEESEPEPELPGEVELIMNGDLIGQSNVGPYNNWNTGPVNSVNYEADKKLYIKINDEYVHTVRMTGPGWNKEIFQEVNVEPGMKIKWGFYGRISDKAEPSGGNHTSTGKLFGKILYGDNYKSEITDAQIEINSSTDTHGTAEFTVPEGVNKVKVLIGKYFNTQPDPNGGLAWVAKVSFKTTPNFIDDESIGTNPTAETGKNWDLVFSDEFNNGNSLSSVRWGKSVSEISRGTRPNLGIEKWFFKEECVAVENGNLILKANKPASGTLYCGAVESRTKYTQCYGYYEAKIKISKTDCGTHTAFWLMPNKEGNEIGTGKDGAEIDIVETPYLEDKAQSAIHIDGYAENHQQNLKVYNTENVHSDFHTFGMWWTKDFMRFYYDGKMITEISDRNWISKVDSYIILSVGANFILSGNYFTSQENGDLTQAEVDYIRVWKEK